MNELKGKNDGASHDSVTEQASEVFDNFFETVKDEIKNENKEFNVALIKFTKRFETLSQNQKDSAFQSFGTTCFGRKNTKIKVQPTAVSRRKSKIGSRENNVRTSSLPNRSISLKRKHNMKEIFVMNVPFAKKAGRSMVSNTKYFTKARSKFKDI